MAAVRKVDIWEIASLTVGQACTQAAQLGLVRICEPGHDYRHDLLRAYIKTGLTYPGDAIFQDGFALGSSMYRVNRSVSMASIVGPLVPQLKASIASFSPHEKAIYLFCRLGLQLRQTILRSYGVPLLRTARLPMGRRTMMVAGQPVLKWAEDADEPLEELEWEPRATEELKANTGLGLLADLSLISPYVTNDFMAIRRERDDMQDFSYSWQEALEDDDHLLMATAYAMTRIHDYYVRLYAADPIELAKFKLSNPGTIVPSAGKDLIHHATETLVAFQQRGLVKLPELGQTYLRYVTRCLQNYLYYDVTGLRPSDLTAGDQVFSPMSDNPLPLLRRGGLVRVPGVEEMLGTYISSMPSDEVIIQRLLSLPS